MPAACVLRGVNATPVRSTDSHASGSHGFHGPPGCVCPALCAVAGVAGALFRRLLCSVAAYAARSLALRSAALGSAKARSASSKMRCCVASSRGLPVVEARGVWLARGVPPSLTSNAAATPPAGADIARRTGVASTTQGLDTARPSTALGRAVSPVAGSASCASFFLCTAGARSRTRRTGPSVPAPQPRRTPAAKTESKGSSPPPCALPGSPLCAVRLLCESVPCSAVRGTVCSWMKPAAWLRMHTQVASSAQLAARHKHGGELSSPI